MTRLKWWKDCSFLFFILGNHKGLPLRREKPKVSAKNLFFYEVCRITENLFVKTKAFGKTIPFIFSNFALMKRNKVTL